ncbi:MAG: hypothetical protein RL149_393, partial [Actinomycetota bacterium]
MKRPVSRSTRAKGSSTKKPQRIAKISRASVKRTTKKPKRVSNNKPSLLVGKLSIKRPNLKSLETLKVNRNTIRNFQSKSRNTKVVVLTFLSAFIILLLLVLATLFTPLLAVEKIRITGLNKVSLKQVTKAVADQIGKPLPLVSQQSVADELSRFTLVESFSLVSELPHTLHIAISERQPICIVDIKGESYLYDPAGVRLGKATYKDTYPRVQINGEPKSSAG